METTRVPEEENLYQVYNHEKATGNLVTLDALLADLQNTVSSEGNHVGGNATPGYGSLNGARTHVTTGYRSYDNRTSPLPPQS
ncbi:hypothetical protein DMN91_012128 [Ooceraea biroi]|uniref:Uncharacterized protein n=2 Tax=Ooceraea biroi TaxID=2015173 RepID=A0A3L8D8V0_OOCBI|nr:hypothetical protein DMN91_012128 [Ooceraea biroi]